MPIIETNVAPPAFNGQTRYPFALLTAPGMSLLFDAREDAAIATPAYYRKLSRAAHMHAANHGLKFAVRRLPDGSIRVWRLADSTSPEQSTGAPIRARRV